MSLKQPIVSCAIAIILGFSFSACERKGPAEKFGEKIDGTSEGIKDAFQKDGPAEKVGKSIDKAVDRR